MSQSWLSSQRDRDESLGETAGELRLSADAIIAAEEPRKTGLSLGLRIALGALGLLALGWIALAGWSLADPMGAERLMPVLEAVVRLSAPLVLLVGIALLLLILPGRRGQSLDLGSAEAVSEIATQTAQAAARIADAHSQLLSQTKAYGTAADRSASALADAVGLMSDQSGRLAENSASSIASLGMLAERMAAFESSAPQIEARLSTLAGTLDRLGQLLGDRGGALESQLAQAAVVAQDAQRQLDAASQSLAERLGGVRDGAKAASDELASLSELSSARIDLTLDRVKTVLDVTEQRIEQQNSALAQLVDRSREGIEGAAVQSIERFLVHCGQIETTLDRLDERIAEQSDKSGAWLEAAAKGATMLSEQFDALERTATGRTERLGTAVMTLSGETRRLADALESGDQSSEQLVKRTEALLLALDSGIRELDESVPSAIGRVEARLAAMKQKITEAVPGIEGMEAVAAAVTSRMEDSDRLVAAHAATLDGALTRAQTALAGQQQQVEALTTAIGKAGDGMTRLGDKVGPHMVEALVRVRETADAAAKRAREAIGAAIPDAAEKLGKASAGAVEKAIAASVTAQLERLSEIADKAVRTAHGATDTLDKQLKTLSETSAALEQRLAGSAQQIEAQDRDLLTRRSAELIEMLNSRAIDVAKWLNHDVSQTEWNAYLKGDQGIFARRAVKMLDRTELRIIAQLYRDDAEFGEHVNRFVHDFEALLKAVLASRDGSALAVTMLSSDLGKLYVALAQAIDRIKAG